MTQGARALPRHHAGEAAPHGAADRHLLSLSRIELNAHRRPDKPSIWCRSSAMVDGLETLARDRGVSVNVERRMRS